MIEILTRALSFMGIIALVYIFKKVHILRSEDFRVLSTLIAKLTLPCAIIVNFSKRPLDTSLFFLIVLGFAGTILMIGWGYLMGRKKSSQEQAFLMINHSGYNIGTFAIPYLQSFVGPAGVVYASMFDIGNSVLCTGGTYTLASGVLDKKEKTSFFGMLKKAVMSSVPLCTYLVMIALGLLHLKLPQGILTFTGIIADSNGFLAMAMLGLGLELNFNREHMAIIGKIMAARYGFALLFAGLAFFLLPFPYEVRKTLVILFFAPLASFDTIFTEKCNLDVGLASEINSISIIISLFLMTGLLMVL
ncbi:MAG: AEC family transporter [Blautia sp.]